MWIEKQEKKYYLDASKKRGIHLVFDSGLLDETKEKIISFIDSIKKQYFFPIKLNIKLCNKERFKHPDDGHIYYSVFFDNEDENPKRYPEIFIAAKEGKRNPIGDIYFSIAHMITCFYQWFFLEDKRRSHRSLEIEANRWANYICDLYLSSNDNFG